MIRCNEIPECRNCFNKNMQRVVCRLYPLHTAFPFWGISVCT